MAVAPTPEMAAILNMVEQENLPPWENYPHAEARRLSVERNAFWNEGNPPVAKVEDIVLEASPRPVPVRLYVPEGAAETGPAIIYLHGGGWVICSLDTHDGVCRRLANASGLRVVSVDYVMAPEFPFPAPLEDCVAAVRAIHAQAERFGIDPERMAVAGDSAGANLSLATLLKLRDEGGPRLKAGGLIYGVYADDHTTESHRAWGGGAYLLSTATMEWFWNAYVPDMSQRQNPYAAPLHAKDFSGLPPLYLSAAELDCLKDDTDQIVPKLKTTGVEVEYSLWKGVTHACIMFSRMLPDADRQIAEVADFLKRKLV
ncbi:MAG TPA: alpha/beta hydrolase [Geminicoccus sp.]|jgi:acetyl esterase|uniref:alpha/beta hydrolase n=1 Tax=Geminicoccus sp. TaxID=2024832 RepID=UPI002E30FAE2|nr:alpha/beta hydrolase [Geminicoccus sp.]HEX2529300.1 alpha/beta hydrolase [Geminicoccus sp.]